jgi:plasmid stabilization system protein ParE
LAFRVDITEAALADAEHFVEYLRREKRDTAWAERWWNGLLDALVSLEEQPGRGSLVVEAALRSRGLRQILYQSHRIVFELDEQREIVCVLRIYHGSRRGAAARCSQMKTHVQQTSVCGPAGESVNARPQLCWTFGVRRG